MRLSPRLTTLVLLSCTAPLVAQTRHTPAHSPAHAVPAPDPTGPTAVFDTSAGRVVCRLYAKQAPATVATFVALARGDKDWTDGTGAPQHGKPWYDGTQIYGVSAGIGAGDRETAGLGTAGPSSPPEKTGLDLTRAGRLAAVVRNGQQSPAAIVLLDHADEEYAKRATVFGQCDEPSLAVIAAASHTLLSADNRPPHPIVLRRVAIVEEGQPLPTPADPIPGEADLTIPPFPPATIPAPEPTGPTATIETTLGTLTCRLFAQEAPLGVANFIGLATGAKPFKNPRTGAEVRGRRFYEGLTFRRVIPDFMIQNADMPFDPEGGGDLGIKFANEIAPGLSFDRPGRLAYANSGPGTNSSEFFVTTSPIRRLDGSYTIFGQCDDPSVHVAQTIAAVPRDEHNKPLTPVVIQRVTIAPTK